MHNTYCSLRSPLLELRTGNQATDRRCQLCLSWECIAKVGNNHCAWPTRLSRCIESFSPGLWVIPSRCYWRHNQISDAIHRGSHLFYRFKAGRSSLAFPLALAMYEALKQQRALTVDCIVPIPLSPDKQTTGQINRTGILAQQLASLLGVPIADVLSLRDAISKRQFLSAGLSRSQFEYRYHQLLHVDTAITQHRRILLLDDVCTHGSTLNCALRRIREVHPASELTATTAGQMILRSVVADEHLILAPKPRLLFAM